MSITEMKMMLNMDARNSTKQREFAKKLHELYKTCVICGISIPVEGAHIVPWCDREEFDIDNGLLMCNNHHALFDRFLFTIDPNTLIIKLSNEMNEDKHHKVYKNKIICVPKEINLDNLKNNLSSHYDKFTMHSDK